ncbi:peptide transporter [Clostridia bacterium]|nr:peptide transporter [Clostridia bacterium]
MEPDALLSLEEEYNQQGKALLAMGKPIKALEYFRRAEKENPQYRPTYMNLGDILIRLDQFDDAKKAYEKALLLNRKDPEVMFHLGNVAFLTGDNETGRAQYAKAITLGYDGPDLFMNQGYLAAEEGRYDEAVDLFNKAIARDQFHHEAWMGKTKAYLNTGKTTEALKSLSSMLQLMPQSFEGHQLHVMTYLQLGKYIEADKAIKFAQRMFPDEVRFKLDNLLLLEAQGKAQDALNYLDEHFKDDNETEAILLERGRILSGFPNRLDEAAECFERAQGMPDPELSREASFSLMLLSMQRQDARKALVCCDMLLENQTYSDTFAVTALYMKGFLYGKLEDTQARLTAYQDAIEKLRLMCGKEPGRTELYLLRGFCYRDIGAFDQALDMAQFLLDAKPDFAEALFLRASVNKEKGESKKAQADFAAVKVAGGISGVWLGQLVDS